MPGDDYERDGLTVAEAVQAEQGDSVDPEEEVDVDIGVVDGDEEPDGLDEVMAKIGAGDGVDPIQALIDAPRVVDTGKVRIRRLDTSFVVQAIDDDRKYDKLVEQCTRLVRNRRGGGRSREVDGRRLAKLTVVEYTVVPGFKPGRDGFEQLVERYKTNEPENLVSEALYIGEIDALADKILELSGFEDDLENAGN